MAKRFGVVSSGLLGQGNNGSRHFKGGEVVELGDSEIAQFLGQAPLNFVELVEGFEWNADVARLFLPGAELFHVTFSREAQLEHQAKIVGAQAVVDSSLNQATSSAAEAVAAAAPTLTDKIFRKKQRGE